MKRICKTCKKDFNIKPSRVKSGKGKYCSRECFKAKVKLTCVACKKSFTVRRSETKNRRYCSVECVIKQPPGNFGFRKGHTINIGRISKLRGKKRPEFGGKKHWNWHGGKVIHKSGYVQIYSPNHPNKSMRCYVPEHRLVMEKKLGRYLKKNEIVHHKNGNRHDNRIKNLQLVVWGKNWHPKTCPKCNFHFLIK